MSNQIDRYQPANNMPAVPSLDEQMRFAEALAGASLLPRSYQKQPANVLLAIQTGYGLGLPPMEAIQSIHVIEGKPTMSADLMASLIRRAGHKLRVGEEQTPSGPVVTATLIRRDDPEFPFVARWDRDKAKAAGLTGKGNWAKYEGQMLRSRAITEVARMGASDVLHGVIYDPEEISPASVTVSQSPAPVSVDSFPTGPDVTAWLDRIQRTDTIEGLRDLWREMPPEARTATRDTLDARRATIEATPAPVAEPVAEPAGDEWDDLGDETTMPLTGELVDDDTPPARRPLSDAWAIYDTPTNE